MFIFKIKIVMRNVTKQIIHRNPEKVCQLDQCRIIRMSFPAFI